MRIREQDDQQRKLSNLTYCAKDFDPKFLAPQAAFFCPRAALVKPDAYDSCCVLIAGLFLGSKTLKPKNIFCGLNTSENANFSCWRSKLPFNESK